MKHFIKDKGEKLGLIVKSVKIASGGEDLRLDGLLVIVNQLKDNKSSNPEVLFGYLVCMMWSMNILNREQVVRIFDGEKQVIEALGYCDSFQENLLPGEQISDTQDSAMSH